MSKWMKHPKLPQDQLIQVLDEAVEGNRRAGWEVTEPPPSEPTADELEAAADETVTRTESPKAEQEPDTDTAAVDERPSKTTAAKTARSNG
jgi:hypothetical protein